MIAPMGLANCASMSWVFFSSSKGKRVNDLSPLPALIDEQPKSPPAAQRWRGNLRTSDADAKAQDFAGDQDGRDEAFLRLWPEEPHEEQPRGLKWPVFSLRALQGAVIANGGALIALALLMAAPNNGSNAGLMTSAIVLGFGLMFAAASAVASLDVHGAQMRLMRIAAPLAGVVSYGALAAAFALI